MWITKPCKKSSTHGVKNQKRVSSVNGRTYRIDFSSKITFFIVFCSARLGLAEFFAKYPSYAQASDRIFAILRERAVEREAFWRERIAAVVNDNRLKDLAERVQTRRTALIKRLLERAEVLLERFVPKVDQANIDKRIADYVGKIVAGFEQSSKQNTAQWKAIFKAIDDASKGEENKWFRTLVADIDSTAFATAADAETAKVFKKLGDSSKLLISNIQQLSRRITKQQEGIRERVRNAIRHIPKVCSLDLNIIISRTDSCFSF